jgi:DnaK suppressor protein
MIEDIEVFADPIDAATALTEELNAKSLADWRSSLSTGEVPDIDENGVRYCLDCAEIISKERIAAAIPDPVRCVDCQNIVDKKKRGVARSGSGGILSALDNSAKTEQTYMNRATQASKDATNVYREKTPDRITDIDVLLNP